MCTNGLRIFTMLLFALIAFTSNYFMPSIPILVWYFVTVSIFAFILFGIDKFNATKERMRVPEMSFHFLAFIGGGLGVMLGIVLFRHKTHHKMFIGIQFAILVLYVVASYLIIQNLPEIAHGIEALRGQ
ncbi:DUF1294 domain-containing protein [Sulfurospirillum sp. 1612]|uniref:DUF1294 domain-containing protein n=1 Tax=Sulfurospirillum sp. 1612 TaxID=3094835 RepID=UPI002F93E5A8